MLSDEWLSRYGLLENFNASVTRTGTRTGTGTGTWTTGVTAIALCTSCSRAKKANQTLGFIKRNIQVHNKDLKSTAYKTLVRPQLEYASTVWSPHTDQDIKKKMCKDGPLDG